MNFYKHYIGDFQRDTSHLTMTERGAYLSLMQHYYATESCLPNDHAMLCRIAGAMTKPERDAVKVAAGFFEIKQEGLWHKRIEAELEKTEEKRDVNKRIALNREARKKAERIAAQQTVSTKRAQDVNDTLHENSTIPEPEPEPEPEKEKDKTLLSSVDDVTGKINYKQIFDTYNQILPELPSAILITDKRKSAIRSCVAVSPRFSEDGFWQAYFEKVRESDFLMGRAKDWKADFDFLTTRSKFVKVLEGSY